MTGPGPRAAAARSSRGWAVWSAGLVVVVAAGAATAHGLYVVALGSGTSPGIAWLYPVITDGLALVAYAATSRLSGPGRRYAWAVVVLAAGLSGLAQATYLAGALPPAAVPIHPAGHVAAAPPVLRFGVGAWPAIAAAIAAHLLFLIGTHTGTEAAADWTGAAGTAPVPRFGVPVVPSHPVPAVPSDPVPPAADDREPEPDAVALPSGSGSSGPAVSQLDRARTVARELAARTGELPTVRELAEAASVGRGTANRALGALRAARNGHRHPTDRAALPVGHDSDGHDPSQGAFWEPERS